MKVEFTGERVIPGQVNQSLWNEHVARYAFASRLCRNRRVLDLGCGTGYGTAELAETGAWVLGLDSAPEAIAYAVAAYSKPNLRWIQGHAAHLPFPRASFDLVVAFEVIEHLAEWPALLSEVRRILAPNGQFIVSTPNKLPYAESRRDAGPNPFHEHEFQYGEFRDALAQVFPHVAVFLEDHGGAILFQPAGPQTAAEVRIEVQTTRPEEAGFFVGVCAMAPQTGAPTFAYVPDSAKLLQERAAHIRALEEEIRKKDQWLAEAQRDHQRLLELHEQLQAEVRQKNSWAEQLNEQLAAAGARIVELQNELARAQEGARQVADAYEAKVAELEEENRRKTEWAIETEARLSTELRQRCDELAGTVALLDRAEKTVEERTAWARDLEGQRAEFENRLRMVQASRWVRLGRVFGLGPELRKT
ncbi:MAG: methyltransferase domain-containing protein [Acidobacteria bacterium]|nr:methyltransferase domain-containing protein [Acidobacteriota bacterium]